MTSPREIEQARRYALSLPDATEAPHFHFSSLRVVGVRVILAKAEAADVESMLYSAWCRKAPKTLVKKTSAP